MNYFSAPGISIELLSLTPDEAFMVVLRKVCDRCEVSATAVMEKGRKRKIVFAKHYIRFILDKVLDFGCLWTGRKLNCHHATVLHSGSAIINTLNTQEGREYFYSIAEGLLPRAYLENRVLEIAGEITEHPKVILGDSPLDYQTRPLPPDFAEKVFLNE